MAEDKMYFFLTSQSGTGEVILFSGSPTMANLQMQAQCHPVVLPSQNVSFPTAQKGEWKHGHLPLILFLPWTRSHSTSAQSNFSGSWEM